MASMLQTTPKVSGTISKADEALDPYTHRRFPKSTLVDGYESFF